MQIALFRPEIPPNTGNIARLCVCTGTQLHIIGKPAFSLSDKAVKRAGLDYWEELSLSLHADWSSFCQAMSASGAHPLENVLLISKFGKISYDQHSFRSDECIILGNETSGLPEEIHEQMLAYDPQRILKIPMSCRSLNLSNAAAIVLYEALRQTGFKGLGLPRHNTDSQV